MYFSLIIVLTRILLKFKKFQFGIDSVYKIEIVFGIIWFICGAYYLVISLIKLGQII